MTRYAAVVARPISAPLALRCRVVTKPTRTSGSPNPASTTPTASSGNQGATITTAPTENVARPSTTVRTSAAPRMSTVAANPPSTAPTPWIATTTPTNPGGRPSDS